MLTDYQKKYIKKALTEYDFRKLNSHNERVIINLLVMVIGAWSEEDESVRQDYYESNSVCPVFPPTNFVLYWVERLLEHTPYSESLNNLDWIEEI